MIDISELKKQITWEYVLQICDLEVPEMTSSGVKIRSFTHNDSTPSLHLYPDGHWFDYSAHCGGDQLSFVMGYLNIPFGRALRLLERGLDDPLAYSRPRNEARQVREPKDFSEYLEAKTYPMSATGEKVTEAKVRVCDYAKRRWGIRPTTLDMWGVRFDLNDIIYFVHREGGVFDGPAYGVKRRFTREGSKLTANSVKGSQFTHSLYMRRPWAPRSRKLIVEGEPDALASWEALAAPGRYGDANWFDVAALPSGVSTLRPEWFQPLLGRNDVWICFDDDDAGRDATDRVLDMCPTLHVMELPDDPEVVDCADAHKLGYAPFFDESEWRMREMFAELEEENDG